MTVADGRRVFVKAMDADRWPWEAELYRAEVLVNAVLPVTVPAPRLIGTFDGGQWVCLAFQDIDGAEPRSRSDLARVVAAVVELARDSAHPPIPLPRDHPRLGGWAELARDRPGRARLATHSAWAAGNLPRLVRLEEEGLAAAAGDSLVHCDLYPHNVLMTADSVAFIDWPHARLGSPVIDLVTVLSGAASHIDPELALRASAAEFEPETISQVLTAHAGFLVRGGLTAMPPGLEAIAEAKLLLGLGALRWLKSRLDGPETRILN